MWVNNTKGEQKKDTNDPKELMSPVALGKAKGAAAKGGRAEAAANAAAKAAAIVRARNLIFPAVCVILQPLSIVDIAICKRHCSLCSTFMRITVHM